MGNGSVESIGPSALTGFNYEKPHKPVKLSVTRRL